MPVKKLRLTFNAPVTLSFCAVCLAAMLLNILTSGSANQLVFSVYRAPLSDPLTYVRLIAHVFGHSSWEHFFGNIMYIMILGPMLEEKHGTANMAILYLITAVVTGLISYLFFPYVRMLGASGIVFSLILLSSFTRTEQNTIPVTFLLVVCLYLGQQVHEALTIQRNVAYVAHFGGGVIGAVAGFTMNRLKWKRY